MAQARAKLARLAVRLNAQAGLAGALPPLVLMTDDERLPDPLDAAEGLPRGSMIVVRARERARRLALATRLARVAFAHRLVLLIADDPELAAHASAHGVHFPEGRAGEIGHWRARRPSWLLTASAHSLTACAHAARCGADAVFVSPVFATKSHPGRTALTPIRLRRIAQLCPARLYALGGVDFHSAVQLAGARLAGIAAVGALAGPLPSRG